MRHPAIKQACAGAFLACCVIGAQAQSAPDADIGATRYQSECMACHGPQGKGNGAQSAQLAMPASDLTTLAKRNGGTFPVQRVIDVIDGRQFVARHGSRDMPTWGAGSAPSASFGSTSADAQRAQFMPLIEYLRRLQTS